MEPVRSEGCIVAALAELACERITRRTVRALQAMRDSSASGDDSSLLSIWEELCVQLQGEQSIFWNLHEEIVCGIIEAEFEKLSGYERDAVWLQTDEGGRWDEDTVGSTSDVKEDCINFILQSYVYSRACDWTNPRIRKHLERPRED